MSEYEEAYAGQGEEGRLLQIQLENERMLDRFRHRLLGERLVFNEQKRTYEYKKTGAQLLNEKGANYIMNLLEGITDKVFILTDLEDDQIRSMVFDLLTTTRKALALHYSEWGIRDTSDMDSLQTQIGNFAHANLRRSYHGRTLDMMKTQIRMQDVQQVRTSEQTKKRSFLGGLKGHDTDGMLDKIVRGGG